MKQQFLLLALGLLTLLLSGCAWLYDSGKPAENGSDLSHLDLEVKPFSYTNQAEETVTNEDLEGKYWIADMIFTSCPTVCNLMTPNMLNLQGELEQEGVDVQFVSFSVDPEFDNPDRLKKYGENYGADFSSWHFLTGYSDEEIKKLANETFQTTVEKDPEQNDIIHSTKFFLIDPEGNVIRSYDGLENDADPIVEDLKRLSNS
ncbi:SCO family protein [Alteribacillus bidgolensis]|uniref:Protein SCO1/2 n=1 Tax=Alteribacillus bidgolensis TaxID=930129 RepID=A0A1G8J450_9BACI|nr:SCO family protein [Alteribacillus bidgolensis]SDI25833.1 protein SCO1/2 [Alteribacillus bidgolensis]